jgi:PKD repeat protein
MVRQERKANVPRLSFIAHGLVFSHIVLCAAGAVAVAQPLGEASAFAAPAPVIQSTATTGTAPFKVRVHALNSGLTIGSELTARYEWNSGDANGQYNTLVGSNAAHVYDQPGNYMITLRVTEQAGDTASVTRRVTVTANTRAVAYVSDTGSDVDSGAQRVELSHNRRHAKRGAQSLPMCVANRAMSSAMAPTICS